MDQLSRIPSDVPICWSVFTKCAALRFDVYTYFSPNSFYARMIVQGVQTLGGQSNFDNILGKSGQKSKT